MPSAGIAPASAPSRALIGPVQTWAGFRQWYLVCSSDSIVAVRQGFWIGIVLTLSPAIPPMPLRNLVFLALEFGNKQARKKRLKLEAEIPNIPTSRLRMAPNEVFEVSQLRSIAIKGRNIAGVITPDITLETTNGLKRTFGIIKPDYDKACPQLKLMYPNLCKFT
jgi:hypothetical protein